ncbi:hypothetical protein DFH08DRAFT_286747 [Mycena albidolilacea]|uniref:Uncharacterized protein n=1 Tax=Mycena albidolilacea TaxID=1033008 RepID=A0AAD6ZRQ1_9AGAR|nr:hypothetical protein DFH08DRAFT_286747 [Mycena albidolilacea]
MNRMFEPIIAQYLIGLSSPIVFLLSPSESILPYSPCSGRNPSDSSDDDENMNDGAVDGLSVGAGARGRRQGPFVVRDEYTLFMERAMSHPGPHSYFVTGQPGIGKGYGRYYFLFRLLALGRLFYIIDDKNTFYFSEDGVQRCQEPLQDIRMLATALSTSWVLIDLAAELDFLPPRADEGRSLCDMDIFPPIRSE